MKTVTLGTKNDTTVYAMQTPEGLVPCDQDEADVKIKYDSGVYPMTLEQLDRVMCEKADALIK